MLCEILGAMECEGISNKSLWEECAQTATMLDVIVEKRNKEKSSYEEFYQRKPKLIHHLYGFCKKEVIMTNKKIKYKLTENGELE